jgi:hypothetical protein
MAVPPAAEPARYPADLSMIALEAIALPCGTILNQSPDNPDQLLCS